MLSEVDSFDDDVFIWCLDGFQGSKNHKKLMCITGIVTFAFQTVLEPSTIHVDTILFSSSLLGLESAKPLRR